MNNKTDFLNKYPIDGSYRKMKRTSLITRLPHRDYAKRTVYQHTPTGNLFYSDRGTWCGTYENYCLDTETGIRGNNY